ncbi:20794_t:CDS:2, partial [Racocetra persica]
MAKLSEKSLKTEKTTIAKVNEKGEVPEQEKRVQEIIDSSRKEFGKDLVSTLEDNNQESYCGLLENSTFLRFMSYLYTGPSESTNPQSGPCSIETTLLFSLLLDKKTQIKIVTLQTSKRKSLKIILFKQL